MSEQGETGEEQTVLILFRMLKYDSIYFIAAKSFENITTQSFE